MLHPMMDRGYDLGTTLSDLKSIWSPLPPNAAFLSERGLVRNPTLSLYADSPRQQSAAKMITW